MTREIPRILLVDDEQAVLDLLVYNLKKAHFETVTAADGQQALKLAAAQPFDLILLDLMLPVVDGLDVCRSLRRTSNIPIIMITARGEEVDRVIGLELGADDYICKPFGMRELVARVKAVLRRTRGDDTPPSQLLNGPAGLVLDGESREVRVGATLLDLTRLEFDLLFILLRYRGKVLTRERLLELVWGYDFNGDTRAVDSAIKRLRACLRSADSDADGISAVRGLGYKFKGQTS